MFKVTLLFGKPKDEAAFEEYVRDVHLPLGAAVPGIDRIEVHRLDVISSTMSPRPDLYRMVDLSFASQEHLRAALASPECQAALADLDNFATDGVTTLTSIVEWFRSGRGESGTHRGPHARGACWRAQAEAERRAAGRLPRAPARASAGTGAHPLICG